MTEKHAGNRVDEASDKTMGRRGVLAWAATLASAGLAWLGGARRAEATHLATGTPGADSLALHVDSVNDGVQRTFLVANVTSNPPEVIFNGVGPFSIGLSDGLQGITTKASSAAGVRGRNMATTGLAAGVIGEAFNNGAGVVGVAGVVIPSLPSGVGVYGHTNANNGVGVRGQIPALDVANTIAVYGANFSTNPGPGSGAGGFGCYGFSALGHGLVGATAVAGGSAVVGATNGVAGAYAGVFYGPLVVVGGPKSAAVRNGDGTHRLLYCVESPESWFEDFGKATLVRGRVTVPIDHEFRAVADLSDYHVFLTPCGNTRGLHVARQTPMAFTVQEHDDGTGELSFCWRLVAKRKDIAAERFAKVVLPKEPLHPTPPAAAPASEPPIIAAPGKPKRRQVKHPHK